MRQVKEVIPVISSSFIQPEPHLTKSSRFQHVKPEYVATVLKKFDFDLVSLKTGRARNFDRVAHQTTIARYRSNKDFKINGLNLDIVFKIPHLYGAIEAFLGTYRQVCSNGLIVGEKFTSMRIKHLGNPIQEIESLVPTLVAQESQLIQTIEAMQNTGLNFDQMRDFATKAMALRIEPIAENVTRSEVFLTARRPEDTGTDVFSVFNRIQENSIRMQMPYVRVSRNTQGAIQYRNMNTRRLNESSVKALDINRELWNIATTYLKVG